ncbi:TRAP transporter small permease [Paracraurococcus lichenis]|uniref:TRAP transporter small permease protein n=1 Tax=Paracraurococcus lichenis TaxID=3064888 RepID=A0ABT9DS40_9PROT|nr:TRAP transporter small permease [Paracraurococcus sp. LOR1-02]MDO9706709.1 TRAP transporter small permease [Paracraurococcus sp. LOR1-02]
MAEPFGPPRGPVAGLARGLALAGGAALLATALLTTWSVVQRWLTRQPVPGDFELVSLGSGLAVMGFLAYGTLMRSNILVDSFTGWLPRRVNDLIDAVWALVWVGAAGVLAERLLLGARETLSSGTTTMVLGLPTWWAIGLGALAFAATAVAGLYWTLRLARGRG